MTADLLIRPDGTLTAIYSDELPLRELAAALGASLEIRRASAVEPTASGEWTAAIVDGPTLGPFPLRAAALAAEVAWLREHRL